LPPPLPSFLGTAAFSLSSFCSASRMLLRGCGNGCCSDIAPRPLLPHASPAPPACRLRLSRCVVVGPAAWRRKEMEGDAYLRSATPPTQNGS
jgi:hypothetical protein